MGEQKSEALKTLQAECISRADSAMYLLHLLLIVHRVKFNIVGRDISVVRAADGDRAHKAEAQAVFLDSSRNISEEGIEYVVKAIRKAVGICSERDRLLPSS